RPRRPGPRSRPARYALAPVRLRPHPPHLPLPGSRLPSDGRAWESAEGNPGGTGHRTEAALVRIPTGHGTGGEQDNGRPTGFSATGSTDAGSVGGTWEPR